MALVAENISLYLSGFNILRNINLSISAGKVTAIVGPNGAGKSTLIKVLSGDILPTSGGVLLNDKKLDRWPLEQRAKTMSVLPQHSSLDFPFTASEVVSLGRIPHQTGIQKDNEIVDKYVIQDKQYNIKRTNYYGNGTIKSQGLIITEFDAKAGEWLYYSIEGILLKKVIYKGLFQNPITTHYNSDGSVKLNKSQ